MAYPTYLPFSGATNFESVMQTALEMRSDLVAKNGCCGSSAVKKAIAEADTYLFIAPFDKINNTERYKEDAKAAYLLLYQFA